MIVYANVIVIVTVYVDVIVIVYADVIVIVNDHVYASVTTTPLGWSNRLRATLVPALSAPAA